jgi:ABC-type multidrug transport system permease subunit
MRCYSQGFHLFHIFHRQEKPARKFFRSVLSAFLTGTLPIFLQTLVRINPVSLTITAIRTILRTGAWGTGATMVLVSGGLIILIFMSLTVLVYQRRG